MFHNKTSPMKTPTTACRVCGQLFLSNSAKYDHLRKVHRNDPFLCKICGKEYQSRGGLHTHTSTKHRELEKGETQPYTKGVSYGSSYYMQLPNSESQQQLGDSDADEFESKQDD